MEFMKIDPRAERMQKKAEKGVGEWRYGNAADML